ncbi:MAG: ATP-binding protein [Cyanobacteria bacterium P01_D01_bin.1]
MKPQATRSYTTTLLGYFLRRYSQASLPLKVSLPFVLVFASCWIIGTLALGEYFSFTLERRQTLQAQELIALVKRELDKEREDLRLKARLLSNESEIVLSTEAADTTQLRRLILPLQSILGADVISIVGSNRQLLLEAKQAELQRYELWLETEKKLTLTGSDITTIVSTTEQGPPVLIGTAPIKTNLEIIGGVIVGITLGDTLLTELNEAIDENLVIVSNNSSNGSREIIASTFAKDNQPDLRQLQTLTEKSELSAIHHPDFTVQGIHLDGLDGQDYYLFLLLSDEPLHQAKKALWFVVAGITVLGSLVTALVAQKIGRKTAQPIQEMTEVAQQVTQEKNFELRITADRKDEIGLLADALNQLIVWVSDYTHALEESAETLEQRVEARTEDLAQTIEQLKSAQSQLIQTEKMSSLGQMVAGIAHEINNPISFIQGNIAPLKDYFQDLLNLLETYRSEYPHPTETVLEMQDEIDLAFILEDSDKLLESMQFGTQRVRDIVVSLRNYSRLDEAAVKDVDIHEGIDSTLLILNHRIKEGVDVIKDYGDLPQIRCSPSQLNQVFTNIIANALDAMSDADSNPMQLMIMTRASSSNHVQIRIRDTGPGMTPEIKAKIFDPFFTTKVVGKGTGLGMGICFKIIEQHQGQIDVVSEVGKGSEVIITLPASAFQQNPRLDSTKAIAGSGSVLAY